jgi:DNA damage-binding protein 1
MTTAPTDLDVKDGIIAVADVMKSISLLKFKPSKRTAQGSLVEIGRHYEGVWATAVAILDSNTFLEADAEGNVLMLSLNQGGITSQEKERLVPTADFRLGEMVNRIRRFDVPASAEAIVTPRAFLATVNGSIYLFATIKPEKIDLLFALQNILASTLTVHGALKLDATASYNKSAEELEKERLAAFNSFRAFRSQNRQLDDPYRSVDGELIERFLDLDEKQQQSIGSRVLQEVKGEMTVEDLRNIVESLKRLH